MKPLDKKPYEKKRDFNSKDENFKKINDLLSGGSFNHSMDKSIDNAHKRLKKDVVK